MHVLVFYPDSQNYAILKETDLPPGENNEKDEIIVSYGRKKYDAVILKKSHNLKWLKSLTVSKEGKIVYGKSTKKVAEEKELQDNLKLIKAHERARKQALQQSIFKLNKNLLKEASIFDDDNMKDEAEKSQTAALEKKDAASVQHHNEQERKAQEKDERGREDREKKAQKREDREKQAKKKEAQQKQERERKAQEKEEREREAREKQKQKREAKENAERERKAREKAEREREDQEREARKKEAQEREAQEKAERERKARERKAREREVREKEAQEREAQKREDQEKEERDREVQEREAQEEAERQRKARERKTREREAREKEAQEREAQKREDQEKEERDREVQEREAQEEAERQRKARERNAREREEREREARGIEERDQAGRGLDENDEPNDDHLPNKVLRNVMSVLKNAVKELEKILGQNTKAIDVKKLPAYHDGPGKMRFHTLYIEKMDYYDANRFKDTNVNELVRRLMKSLVGEDNLSDMTPLGNKHRVGIPMDIRKTVYTYAKKCHTQPDTFTLKKFYGILANQCTTLRNPKTGNDNSFPKERLRDASAGRKRTAMENSGDETDSGVPQAKRSRSVSKSPSASDSRSTSRNVSPFHGDGPTYSKDDDTLSERDFFSNLGNVACVSNIGSGNESS